MENTKRETVATRKAQILAAAFNMAKEDGLVKVTQSAIAKRLSISRPLVVKYYKAEELTAAVVLQAIGEGHLYIIGEAIALRVPEALGAPASLKKAAVNSFLS